MAKQSKKTKPKVKPNPVLAAAESLGIYFGDIPVRRRNLKK